MWLIPMSGLYLNVSGDSHFQDKVFDANFFNMYIGFQN